MNEPDLDGGTFHFLAHAAGPSDLAEQMGDPGKSYPGRGEKRRCSAH